MNVDTPGSIEPRADAWATAAVPPDDYAEIARSLASPDSPVGIDAKHTHVLILHALDRIERKLADAGAHTTPGAAEAVSTVGVRPSVRRLLERSSAFAALPLKRRELLPQTLERLVLLAAGGDDRAAAFPDFVADLLEGVFEAVVDVSIEQMEAYADLLEDASESAEHFSKDVKGRTEARQRDRLLAMMALLGFSRVSVRHGSVRARTVFDVDDEDED